MSPDSCGSVQGEKGAVKGWKGRIRCCPLHWPGLLRSPHNDTVAAYAAADCSSSAGAASGAVRVMDAPWTPVCLWPVLGAWGTTLVPLGSGLSRASASKDRHGLVREPCSPQQGGSSHPPGHPQHSQQQSASEDQSGLKAHQLPLTLQSLPLAPQQALLPASAAHSSSQQSNPCPPTLAMTIWFTDHMPYTSKLPFIKSPVCARHLQNTLYTHTMPINPFNNQGKKVLLSSFSTSPN